MSRPVPDFLVTFAVPEEARPFERLVRDLPEIRVARTGIGQRQAGQRLLQALNLHHPDAIITAGFAGGLHPGLSAGQIVFEAAGLPQLVAPLTAAGGRPIRFTCVDHVAVTAHAKHTLRMRTGADAVEMESETLHEIARTHGIPCATVRVVLDTANEDLPMDFNRFLQPDGTLQLRQLLGGLLAAPHRIPALMRFHQRSRDAAFHLATVLDAVLRRAVQSGSPNPPDLLPTPTQTPAGDREA